MHSSLSWLVTSIFLPKGLRHRNVEGCVVKMKEVAWEEASLARGGISGNSGRRGEHLGLRNVMRAVRLTCPA